MRNIEFVPNAFKEYQAWIQTDRKTALRIGDLIRDIFRNPFEGIGKPEPLKWLLEQKDRSRRQACIPYNGSLHCYYFLLFAL
jgi:Txe/YoeB family toxin of toxin-antitoxin system